MNRLDISRKHDFIHFPDDFAKPSIDRGVFGAALQVAHSDVNGAPGDFQSI
jgi:hypothetical protein